jgi:transposase
MASMSLSEEQFCELRAAIKPGTYDGSVSARAQIVLWHHEGYRKADIAEMSGASRPTIDQWIDRHALYGVGGLTSETSPGGRRTIPGSIRGRVLALTRQTPPEELGISHWTSAKMAAYIKKTEGVPVSQPWVSRLRRDHGLQPWRQGTFKISKGPDFEEKIRDVTGLYLNPPEGEAVVSAGVKSGIQALDRTQPMLPAGFGKSKKRTHDYKRHGTTDMYAGFDVVTGNVTVELSPTHNAQDFLRLMKKIVAQYAGTKKIHVVPVAGGPGSGWGKTEPQPEPAQDRKEPQRGCAGPGDDERGRSGAGAHQEYAGRLRYHQHRQTDGEQQEDGRPQPCGPLKEAVQSRVRDGRLPERDHLGRQPGNERVRATGCPGE